MHESLSWKIVNTNNKTKKGYKMKQENKYAIPADRYGQLQIQFEPLRQLAIQFKERQK